MNAFTVEIAAEDASETIEGVESFVGVDESGSFGILAGREPLVTALGWGLCRLRTVDGAIKFLALPGGILSFENDVLRLATQHYFLAAESGTILQQLDARMRSELQDRRAMREMLHNLDRELLRRLLQQG